MAHKHQPHADHGDTQAHSHVHACRLLTREDCARIDRLASEQYGIPSIVLMENAGRSVADYVASSLPLDDERPAILVLAGSGSNGGDGFVAARHLANLGMRVGVITSAPDEAVKGDALTNLKILRKMGLPIRAFDPSKPRAALSALPAYLATPDLIIDALLGTGYRGDLKEPMPALIDLCNELGDKAPIISIDLPSGLDADTGQPGSTCIEADLTVCLVSLKPGVLTEAGRPFCGQLLQGDIGVPLDLIERFGEVVEFECDHDHEADEEDDDAGR